jgi:hypothetical protein
MILLAFLATALYWPRVEGAVTTPRWALLAIAVPWLLREQRSTAAHVAGGVFLLWAGLTMAWNPAPLDGFGALLTLFVLACCFCLGTQLASLRPVIIGGAAALGISSVIAIAQYVGLHPILTQTVVSGLFVNGNFMAEAAAMVLVAAVAERLWWVLPGVLPALVLPFARGAALACGVALIVHFRRSAFLWSVVGGAVTATALYIAVKGGADISERLTIWQSTLNGVTLFGHGIGSFWSVYPAYDLRGAVTSTPEFAHNEFLHVAFELGIVGLVLFVTFCVTLAGPLDTARLVLIVVLVESLFEFPLHEPTTAFLGMVAAGCAVRNRFVLWRGAADGRGFSAAGMADGELRAFHAFAAGGGSHYAVGPSLSGVSGKAGAQGNEA